MTELAILKAAKLIQAADSLLIAAGAGMGVDSGLPDFRGNDGFWNAYPALAKTSTSFTSIANPLAFYLNPRRAWGFYGHRMALYRKTIPHEGFSILQDIAKTMEHGAFVVTSNVDGQFQKAGFSSSLIYEIHGSIHNLQCITPCCHRHWSANEIEPHIDDESCEWIGSKFPSCPYCGAVARPAILMFNDSTWQEGLAPLQRANFEVWMSKAQRPVIIELGAGIHIPSIRNIGDNQKYSLIRINPLHSQLRDGALGVSIAMGAKEALIDIAQALKGGDEINLNFKSGI